MSESLPEIWLPGKPVPKLRQRTLKAGHSYDPQHNLKLSYRSVLQSEWQSYKGTFLSKPIAIAIDFDFYFQPPVSWSKQKQKVAINLAHHVIKPDISNLVKFYEDVMNGILFEDDSQIAELVARKRYAEQDGTKIQIRII